MNHWCIGIVWVAACILVGCKTTQPTPQEQAAGLPAPFEIELRSVGKDGRVVYYVLEHDGKFNFGGGKIAIFRETEPLGTLTIDQRVELWRIIESQKLLEAKGEFMPRGEKINWDVKLIAGSKQRRCGCRSRTHPRPGQTWLRTGRSRAAHR